MSKATKYELSNDFGLIWAEVAFSVTTININQSVRIDQKARTKYMHTKELTFHIFP